MKSIIFVHSRRKIDLRNFQEGDILISDIAHSLANQCRFNGHTKKFYSVAEHSVRVAQYFAHSGFKRELILAALLHDAAEAYIGDVIRPVKGNFTDLQKIEDDILQKIFARFGCDTTDFGWQMVKLVDNIILQQEMNALVLQEVLMPAAPLTFRFECWSPETAKEQFLQMFKKLQKTEQEDEVPALQK